MGEHPVDGDGNARHQPVFLCQEQNSERTGDVQARSASRAARSKFIEQDVGDSFPQSRLDHRGFAAVEFSCQPIWHPDTPRPELEPRHPEEFFGSRIPTLTISQLQENLARTHHGAE